MVQRWNIQGVNTQMKTVKNIVKTLSLSPFYNFLFNTKKQTILLRYEIHVM